MCNHCLSPLMLRVWIPLRWGVLNTTLCYKSLSVTYDHDHHEGSCKLMTYMYVVDFQKEYAHCTFRWCQRLNFSSLPNPPYYFSSQKLLLNCIILSTFLYHFYILMKLFVLNTSSWNTTLWVLRNNQSINQSLNQLFKMDEHNNSNKISRHVQE